MEPLKESVEHLRFTTGQHLDGPVGAISGIAADPGLQRLLTSRLAEPDSLDPPLYTVLPAFNHKQQIRKIDSLVKLIYPFYLIVSATFPQCFCASGAGIIFLAVTGSIRH